MRLSSCIEQGVCHDAMDAAGLAIVLNVTLWYNRAELDEPIHEKATHIARMRRLILYRNAVLGYLYILLQSLQAVFFVASLACICTFQRSFVSSQAVNPKI